MAESSESTGQKSARSSKKKSAAKKTSKKKSAGKSKVTTGSANNTESSVSVTSKEKAEPTVDVQAAEGGTAAVSSASNSGSGITIAWIALVFGIGGLLLGGYAWYISVVKSEIESGSQVNRFNTIDQRIDGFNTGQADLTSQLGALKNQVAVVEENVSNQLRAVRNEMAEQDSAIQKKVAASDEELNAQNEDFRQEFETLSDSIIKLRSELGRSLDSWTLEEVEQLIIIAAQRVRFAGDVELAKNALVLADQRLKAVADPALSDVRKAIAAEIAALESVEVFDLTGLLSQITVLANNIGNVPLIGDVAVPEKAEASGSGDSQADESQAAEGSGMDQYTQPILDASAEFFASLGDLIQVEKSGKSVKPVLSAEIRQMIYANTRLKLESAQLAAIQRNGELYSQRMADTRDWVEAYFDPESSVTQRWLEEFDQLAAQLPVQNLPQISGSLDAIRGAIQSSE